MQEYEPRPRRRATFGAIGGVALTLFVDYKSLSVPPAELVTSLTANTFVGLGILTPTLWFIGRHFDRNRREPEDY